MVVSRFPILRFILVALVIAIPAAAFAAPVGKALGGGSYIEWQLSVGGYERITLTVSGPDGEVFSRDFAAGNPVMLNMKDLPSAGDGNYTYQLMVVPKISAAVREQLNKARAAGNDAAARAIMKGAGIGEPAVQTGGFAILNGAIVAPDRAEGGRDVAPGAPVANSIREEGPAKIGGGTVSARPGTPVVNDQVIPDDLIVQQSLCVGFDCVNNESFGFDTIRLKENNLRIKAEDTSVGSFPTNDWQLTFNDSASGGSSKFSVEDITGSRVPFTITAGATTNSIFVDSTGRVGLRSSTPVLDLHINTSNTPAIRLEQNNTGGFTAQTWDIGANEANFFVRDVTGGSKLSFRIRPGAPTSSLDISSDGEVGVGTASPTEELHVKSKAANDNVVIVTNSTLSDTTIFRVFETTAGDGIMSVFDTTGAEAVRLTAVNGGSLSVGCRTGQHDLDLGNSPGTDCASVGTRSFIDAGSTTFTAISSRTVKENLEPMKVENILDRIQNVGVYTYDFINGPKDKLGLIAEDFHTVLQRGDNKTINGQDVEMALWLAVQELTSRNRDLAAQNETLAKRLEKIESQIQK